MIIIVTVFGFLFGTIMASFFGVVIDRLPRGESIVTPPSHCPSCGHRIAFYDNIPILSYLILRGKCRHCHSKIGLFSFVYELLGGLLIALVVFVFGVNYLTLFMVPIALVLYFIAGYDYKTMEILDVSWILLALLAISLFFYRVFGLGEDYLPYLIGAAAGLLFFLAIKLIGRLVLKKECLGGGDVILMGIAGLLLGPLSLLLSVIVGSFAGTVIESILLLAKKKDRGPIAFGPYLVFGILFALLFGRAIIDSLLGVI